MHEMSLVRSLLRQVDEIAREHDVGSVREITVEVGPLSGVEPELVQIAFEQLNQTTTLTIQEVPLVIRCLKCDRESDVNNFIFRCGECGSGRVRVTSGDEFRLLFVTLDERAANV